MIADSTLDELIQTNNSISSVLLEQEVDFHALDKFMALRDELINRYMNLLDDVDKKDFASKELVTQKKFETEIQTHFSSSKNELAKFISARKKTAKYK
ncbi:hypothetical protein J3L16_06075 [Alteromonas sp. 5E99-2]|uniref:hypothetical protein n=1 Tax=Alteromonas sp. 5E99-2 TaxID=2817683 RepID=UPI001A97FBFE|nr:hypothetical protein [Alteromonas sp. 5E99-2]MBO1255251.1 hypothetical protein [Alteromonas sp. 5E99-2]